MISFPPTGPHTPSARSCVFDFSDADLFQRLNLDRLAHDMWLQIYDERQPEDDHKKIGSIDYERINRQMDADRSRLC